MRRGIFVVLAIAAAIAVVPIAKLGAQFAFPIFLSSGKPPPPPGPAPTAVTPNSATVSNNVASGTPVATLSCTMSDASPCPGSAVFSITGSTNLAVSGTTLQTSVANIPTNTYSSTAHVTANGQTANTPFTLTSSSGITPDFGVVFNGSVPPYASRAGFTHLALNADFTQVGGTFSNKANFLANCGYSPPAWPSGAYFIQSYYFRPNRPTPCDDSYNAIVNDGGTQAFRQTYHHNDTGSHTGFWYQGDALEPGTQIGVTMATDWPMGFSQAGHSLPQQMYVEWWVRADASGLGQNTNSTETWDLWGDPWGDTEHGASFFELDMFETFNGGTNQTVLGAGWTNGQGGCTYSTTSGCDFPNEPTSDFGSYIRRGWLVTMDASGNMGNCYLENDVVITCKGGAVDTTKMTNRANNISMDTGYEAGNGNSPLCGLANGNAAACMVNDVNTYIRRVQVWECSSYQTSTCLGTAITGP